MVVVGLGAAGRAGKASAIAALFFLAKPDEDATRDGMGETPVLRAGAGLADEDIHGVWPGLAPIPPPRLDEAAAGNEGNALLEAVDQLALRFA